MLLREGMHSTSPRECADAPLGLPPQPRGDLRHMDVLPEDDNKWGSPRASNVGDEAAAASNVRMGRSR